MKPKVSANEKRLAKLLRDAYATCYAVETWHGFYAAFLANRGVRVIPRHERPFVDNYLQRMAGIR